MSQQFCVPVPPPVAVARATIVVPCICGDALSVFSTTAVTGDGGKTAAAVIGKSTDHDASGASFALPLLRTQRPIRTFELMAAGVHRKVFCADQPVTAAHAWPSCISHLYWIAVPPSTAAVNVIAVP